MAPPKWAFSPNLYQSDLDDELLCSICAQVLDEPSMIPCRHIFCKSCITRWVNNSTGSCPVCRAPVFPEAIQLGPHLISNIIMKMTIRCHNRGCHSRFQVSSAEAHQRICEYEKVPCPNQGCLVQAVMRKDFQAHVIQCAHTRRMSNLANRQQSSSWADLSAGVRVALYYQSADDYGYIQNPPVANQSSSEIQIAYVYPAVPITGLSSIRASRYGGRSTTIYINNLTRESPAAATNSIPETPPQHPFCGCYSACLVCNRLMPQVDSTTPQFPIDRSRNEGGEILQVQLNSEGVNSHQNDDGSRYLPLPQLLEINNDLNDGPDYDPEDGYSSSDEGNAPILQL